MSDLDASKLQEFKDFFIIKQQELNLTKNKKKSEETDDSEIRDDMDLAQSITSNDMSRQMQHRCDVMLGHIRVALEKIRLGTFGNCESCEEPIFEARLKAMPACKYCITCAEKIEHRQRQYR